MTKISDGGPAFPSPEIRGDDGAGICAPEYGMTLRQYYAGQMMAGNLANPESAGSCADFAAYAVELADALIAELEKVNP